MFEMLYLATQLLIAAAPAPDHGRGGHGGHHGGRDHGRGDHGHKGGHDAPAPSPSPAASPAAAPEPSSPTDGPDTRGSAQRAPVSDYCYWPGRSADKWCKLAPKTKID